MMNAMGEVKQEGAGGLVSGRSLGDQIGWSQDGLGQCGIRAQRFVSPVGIFLTTDQEDTNVQDSSYQGFGSSPMSCL